MGKKRKAKKMNNSTAFLFDDDPVFVGIIGKAKIWGGPQESSMVRPWDLVINATTNVARPDIPKFLGCENLLNPKLLEVFSSPTLHIAIPDRKAPTFPKPWWDMLVGDVAKIAGDVLVHCMMGHGRTGLVLCCLFGVAARLKIKVSPYLSTSADIVTWVRRNYDEPNAVEGVVQMNYIKHLGLFTQAKPSDQARTFYPQAYLGQSPGLKQGRKY